MKIRTAYYSTLFFLLLTITASAQYIQVNDTYTAQQLVEDVLVNSPCASVSNFSVYGGDFGSGTQSYGYFDATGTTFPFQNGIVLSTGRAVATQGPNTSLLDDGAGMDWPGDADLQQALSINNSVNATILEFDFVPLGNKISFDYMLSSEEYHDTAPCSYSDGFAFLLREAGSNSPYQNLAVIPGTDIPVKVTSVHPNIPGACGPQNEQYFGGFNGSQHPTNFNGQTAVLKAEANVTPGVQYHIKLVIADEGNYRYDSAIFLGGGSFDVVTDLGPDRLIANDNPLCSTESLQLEAGYPDALSYQWFRNGAPLSGETNSVYDVTDPGVYSVAIDLGSGCTTEGEINIEYAFPPAVVSKTLLQCDEDADGITLFNLNQATPLFTNGNQNLEVKYFNTSADAENGTNEITNYSDFANNTPNQQLYVSLTNEYGCTSVSTLTLATSGNSVTDPSPIESCDDDGTDDGIYTIDLTQAEDEILQGLPANLELQYYNTIEDALASENAIADPTVFTNTVAGGQTVYARIFNGSDCYGIAEIEVRIFYFGESFETEEQYICQDSFAILDAGYGYTSYKWDTDPEQDTQRIFIYEPGNYTVTVTNSSGCSGSKTFTVLPSGKATGALYSINDFTGGESNSIAIEATGLGNFEYSLDGVIYQDEPFFGNLDAGQYQIFIRDKNGCGPIFKDSVYILDYPKFFTPNGDGVNETWRFPYMTQRPGITVNIFDRFGKIVGGFRGNSVGWDGTFKGTKLPATDYWFVIELEDNRIIKGHFALVR